MKRIAASCASAAPLRGLVLAMAVALPVSGWAAGPQKEEARWYAGGHLGVNNLSSWPATVDFGSGITASGRLSFDSGSHWGLAIGRQTEKGRFELEYQRGGMKLTGIQLASQNQSASGNGRYEALTLNAYRFRHFDESFTGYLGVGIGFGRVDLPQASFAGGCQCFPATSDGGLAVQARLGLEYRFGSGHHAFAQYTWLRLPGADSGGAAPSVEYPGRTVGAASVGYRKLF